MRLVPIQRVWTLLAQDEQIAVNAAIVRVLPEVVEMNGSTSIQPSHRQRQGVVYLRRSSPKQVLKNCDCAINQRSLRSRLPELGWRKDQIVLIDDDQGQSDKHAEGREGFQRLVASSTL